MLLLDACLVLRTTEVPCSPMSHLSYHECHPRCRRPPTAAPQVNLRATFYLR